jgi:uncharacterized protein YcgL (UPF0745 family)
MKCFVYKGSKKDDTYIYINREDGFEHLPGDLCRLMGEFDLVLSLELTEQTCLAQANAREVLDAIEAQGFYLQMPGELPELFR